MSIQALYDASVAHLRTMTHRAATPEGKCRYRAPDGSKCIVGALIPDDNYSRAIEGYSPRQILEDHRIPGHGYTYDKYKLLVDLQRVHDDERCWTTSRFYRWDHIVTIARNYKVTHTFASMQELFDAASQYLIRMRKPSRTPNTCKYRNADGNMCVVGFLMPDENYRPEFDDAAAGTNSSIAALPRDIIPHDPSFDPLELLTTLQDLHDDETNWWPDEGGFGAHHKLQVIAAEFGLEFVPHVS